MKSMELTTKPSAAERTWTTPDVFWPALSAANGILSQRRGTLPAEQPPA